MEQLIKWPNVVMSQLFSYQFHCIHRTTTLYLFSFYILRFSFSLLCFWYIFFYFLLSRSRDIYVFSSFSRDQSRQILNTLSWFFFICSYIFLISLLSLNLYSHRLFNFFFFLRYKSHTYSFDAFGEFFLVSCSRWELFTGLAGKLFAFGNIYTENCWMVI